MKRRFLKNGFVFTAVLALLVLASVGFFFRSISAQLYVQAAADTIAAGKTQLFNRSVSGVLSAYQTFQGAYTNDYASATDAEKIKIRAYLAFTRILDVALRNDGGTVDTLTELLAQYGITKTGDAFDGIKFNLPLNDEQKIILPAGAPSSAEALRSFFSGPFLTAVNASIADMDAAIALCPATEGIDREIISKTLINAGDATQLDVEVDAGDYYLFRAMLKALKVYALMSAGYNADLDIRKVVAVVNMEMGPEAIKRLLDGYPEFLKIDPDTGAAKLYEARTTLIGAIDDYMTASDKIRNDNDAVQRNAEELFSLEPDNYGDALLRENLAKIKISLQDPQGNTTADLVTERIGTEYSVYGASSFTTTEPSWWDKGNYPEQYGSTYLGKASDTATFNGAYNFYIIVTKPGNMAPVDTVQGSDGSYLGTNITGGTNQWWNVGGAPNGTYALIGDLSGGGNGPGFIVIRPSTPITSMTVYLTNVANIASEKHFKLNLLPLFGGSGTQPKALRDLLPQLNEYGYPLPGTMGNGLGNDPTLGGILPDFTTQDQWLREMDGMFMPTGPLTIPQVADNAITIDGAEGDWTTAGIAPVLVDVTGERQNMAANGDLQQLFLARDNTYLYIRMDLAGDWNSTAQNFMYGLRFRLSPGDGPDKTGDAKIFARNRNGVWEVKAQSIQPNGWYGSLNDLAASGAVAAASGKIVEWRIPLGGTASGRFLSADTDSWSYYQQTDYGWWPYDKNPTCLQIQPPASVTGTLSVPGYDGVGPIRIGVYEYGPDFSNDPKKRIGSVGIYPDGSGNLPATYTVSNLPVGSKVFVTVFWDRDGNGVLTPGDYTNFSLPFTTVEGGNSLNLTVNDDHPAYPPSRFHTAVVYHMKQPLAPNGTGTWNVLMAAQLTGPSPEDVAVTVTGPGGQYTLMPGGVIRERGLVYSTAVPWLPNGDYTFTAVDSLGRKTETTYHYEALDLPSITSLTPLHKAYLGTTAPTLSWTPPATGGPYAYQVWIQDFNSSNNGATVYVSAITTDTSVTIPAGVLLPDASYRWYVRLYDRATNPMNFTMSPVNNFYTGAYAAAPVFSDVSIGTKHSTGSNSGYWNSVDVKVPGLAPWDVGVWRFMKGGIVVATGTMGSNNVRAEDNGSYYTFGFLSGVQSNGQMGVRPSDGTDYSFEMDVNRPAGSTTTIIRTGISFFYNDVQAMDLTSLVPSSNYYFKTSMPTFSWGQSSDPNAFYRLRIFDPYRGQISLYRSPWSKELSATVPAGVLKPGGSYYWTVQTTPVINSYVNAFVNTEGNSGNKVLYRFTLQRSMPGDINGNDEVNLADAILALQVVSGVTPTVTLGDVNTDNLIGLPEAIYILQTISGLR